MRFPGSRGKATNDGEARGSHLRMRRLGHVRSCTHRISGAVMMVAAPRFGPTRGALGGDHEAESLRAPRYLSKHWPRVTRCANYFPLRMMESSRLRDEGRRASSTSC